MSTKFHEIFNEIQIFNLPSNQWFVLMKASFTKVFMKIKTRIFWEKLSKWTSAIFSWNVYKVEQFFVLLLLNIEFSVKTQRALLDGNKVSRKLNFEFSAKKVVKMKGFLYFLGWLEKWWKLWFDEFMTLWSSSSSITVDESKVYQKDKVKTQLRMELECHVRCDRKYWHNLSEN